MKFPVLGFAVMATVLIAGCGPNLTATPTSPTTTTPAQSPFISQFGGFFNGTLTLVRVSGGECVGNDMQADIGTVDVGTVVISQTQTDVTAVVRSASTGLSCRYSGTAGPGAFALHTQACEVNQILFQCINGASRVLEQVGSTFTATLGSGGATGTVTTFYNVFSDSTEEDRRRPVAGLVLEEHFNAVRR
jgi:hypothetical protein